MVQNWLVLFNVKQDKGKYIFLLELCGPLVFANPVAKPLLLFII